MRAGGLPFHLPHVGRNLQAPPNSKHGALAPTAKVSKVGLIESRKVGLRQGSKHIIMDAIRVNVYLGMSPVQNGGSYLMYVLARVGKTGETATNFGFEDGRHDCAFLAFFSSKT